MTLIVAVIPELNSEQVLTNSSAGGLIFKLGFVTLWQDPAAAGHFEFFIVVFLCFSFEY